MTEGGAQVGAGLQHLVFSTVAVCALSRSLLPSSPPRSCDPHSISPSRFRLQCPSRSLAADRGGGARGRADGAEAEVREGKGGCDTGGGAGGLTGQQRGGRRHVAAHALRGALSLCPPTSPSHPAAATEPLELGWPGGLQALIAKLSAHTVCDPLGPWLREAFGNWVVSRYAAEEGQREGLALRLT